MSVFDSPRGGSIQGRRGVANGCAIRESVGSKPLSLEFGERVSALRTTRRNASRSCLMPPNPRHGVGARFSQVGLAECRRKPMRGAGSCRLAFGPEQGGACENDYGRERSAFAERGSSSCTHEGGAGGRHRSQKLHRRERPCTTFPAWCLGMRGRLKRSRFTARHLLRVLERELAGPVCSHPSNYGIASSRLPCDPRNRRRAMRRLVQAPGMVRSGSSRR